MTRKERKDQLQAAGKWQDFQAIRDELKAEGWAPADAADEAMQRMVGFDEDDEVEISGRPISPEPFRSSNPRLRMSLMLAWVKLVLEGFTPGEPPYPAASDLLALVQEDEQCLTAFWHLVKVDDQVDGTWSEMLSPGWPAEQIFALCLEAMYEEPAEAVRQMREYYELQGDNALPS